MKYWHQRPGSGIPRAEEIPGGAIMMHMLKAIMEQAKRNMPPKPEVTCYLVHLDTWNELRARIPISDPEPHKLPGSSLWPGLTTLHGIPIFVYHSDEERLRLRFQLMQAGHVVGEVQHGPVL